MKAALIALTALCVAGCASNDVITKEVLMPIRCPLKMPLKPAYNGDIKSAKELSLYYLEVESIAIFCTKGDYHQDY